MSACAHWRSSASHRLAGTPSRSLSSPKRTPYGLQLATCISLRYQSNIHPTIFCATIQGVVAADRLTGGNTLDSKATVRDIAHTLHPVANSGSAGTRKIEILGCIPSRIRMPGNNDQPAWLGFNANESIDQQFG